MFKILCFLLFCQVLTLKLPKIPKIPKIPRIPKIPKIPTIPKIPKIPKISILNGNKDTKGTKGSHEKKGPVDLLGGLQEQLDKAEDLKSLIENPDQIFKDPSNLLGVLQKIPGMKAIPGLGHVQAIASLLQKPEMLTNLLKDPTSLLKSPELLTSILQMAVPGLQSVTALTDVLKKVPFLKDLPLMQDLSSIIENPGKLLTDPKALTGLLKTVPGLESLKNLPDLLGGLGKLPGFSELGNLFKKIGENEDAKHCEEGWKYARETTFCYFYKESDEKLFFSAAESECQGKQSHLASVHSEEEMKFLQDLAKTKDCGKPESFAWIGLKVLDGKRVWADGSEDDFVRSDSMNDLANYGICSGENPSDYPIHPLPKSDEQQQSRYICKKRSKDNE